MLDAVNPAAAGGGIAIALFFGILAAIVAGRWIGRRAIAHYGSARAPSVGSMEAAVFALMGLLNLWVAYSFSTDAWVNFKLFGGIGLMLLFMLAQGFYLSRFIAPDEDAAAGGSEAKRS